jgi:hypothetical protein
LLAPTECAALCKGRTNDPAETSLRQAVEGVESIKKLLHRSLRSFNLKYTDVVEYRNQIFPLIYQCVVIGTKSSGKEEDSKYSDLAKKSLAVMMELKFVIELFG